MHTGQEQRTMFKTFKTRRSAQWQIGCQLLAAGKLLVLEENLQGFEITNLNKPVLEHLTFKPSFKVFKANVVFCMNDDVFKDLLTCCIHKCEYCTLISDYVFKAFYNMVQNSKGK